MFTKSKISRALTENLASYESQKRQRAKRKFFLGCLTLAVVFLALYIWDLLNVWLAIIFILVMAAVYLFANRQKTKGK